MRTVKESSVPLLQLDTHLDLFGEPSIDIDIGAFWQFRFPFFLLLYRIASIDNQSHALHVCPTKSFFLLLKEMYLRHRSPHCFSVNVATRYVLPVALRVVDSYRCSLEWQSVFRWCECGDSFARRSVALSPLLPLL